MQELTEAIEDARSVKGVSYNDKSKKWTIFFNESEELKNVDTVDLVNIINHILMIPDKDIQDLFKSEQNRVHDKLISGFYITESQYEGTNLDDEI